MLTIKAYLYINYNIFLDKFLSKFV